MGRRVSKNIGDLGHLDHKGRLSGGQIVRRADAGEQPGPRRRCAPSVAGTKQPICAMQDDQRHLAHISRFARHIGAGDDGNLAALQPELGVVGDKQRALQHLLHNRMAAVEDVDLAGPDRPSGLV